MVVVVCVCVCARMCAQCVTLWQSEKEETGIKRERETASQTDRQRDRRRMVDPYQQKRCLSGSYSC